MESSNQRLPRAGMRGWLSLIISVLLAFFAAVLPVALLLAPGYWAFAGARTKPQRMLLPFAAFAGTAFSLMPTVVAAGLTGAAVTASVLLYARMTRRASNTDTALLLAGVFLAGLYVAVCLPGILEGRGAFADVQAAMGAMNEFYRATLAEMPQINADVANTVLSTMDAMVQAVPTFFVGVLCIFSSILGLSNLLFFRLFCRKHSQIAISPIRPFRDWGLPRSMTLGLFVMLIGSLLLSWTGWEYADSFAVTANILIALPLVLQGLCVLDFFIVRSGKNVTTRRALAYTGIGIVLQFAVTTLMLLGCFDLIFRLRERMRSAPPPEAV